ncbi:MAG: lipid A export permease/ATP-binding protein MsbA [Dokdonella sp.]|uniref:lipid A export permease/ATP-binding protein MsbA n=1 Tax=Dokdonella sp. TaxID=2291710 RepID=UPI0025BF0BB3|nr:lipid A export permease/ATP-binding protein MsbA [Dokdonella sp.]MBZ0221428.1 lipid A export permease/ATP-binding protein MsbA [Dokdonella sp.]MCC7255441.1 lipid A export permease/ATP-binding protein MsbA [Dokdonella sp.]
MSTPQAAQSSGAALYARLLGHVQRYWPIAVLVVLAMVIDAACMGLFAQSIKPMLDDLFVARDPQTIFWMPIVIVAIFLVRSVAVYVTDYGTAYIGRGVVQQLRQQVFDQYLRLPTSFFASEPSGHQIARITYTAEQVAQASTDSVKIAVVDGLSVVFYVMVMLNSSVRLTLALLVMVPLVGALVVYVGRRYRRIGHRIQASMGTVSGVVEETVAANREVKVYGGQSFESARFNSVSEQTRALGVKVAATNGLSSSLIQLIAAISLALIIFFATQPAMLHSLSPGAFTALIMAMGGILPSLKRLTTVQANLQRGLAAAEEIFALIDRAPEVDDGTHEVERACGDLELRDVGVTYPGAGAPALRAVSFACTRGTVTALVGRSGSGKSTLANLIPRFLEADSGSILLDGKSLHEYTLDSLRRQIAWVGQGITLFDTTIARNIAYGALAQASEAEVIAAAEAANAMEFIAQLPLGIHSRVGEGGSQLSGGQRQRIAIARALLKNAPILILDEATSALDTGSERLIQDALQRLMHDRTTLVIAHRLSTIEHADRIVVLDRGSVVEQGTHQQLLARGGHYAALHRLQFRDDTAVALGTD